MIDVKELRIGNWVIHSSFAKPVQIEGVDTNGSLIMLPNEHGEGEVWNYLEGANPIAITPEILEACGFETDKLSYWHEFTIDGAVFWITIGHFKDGFRMLPTGSLQVPCRKINGLHDLQNLVHSQTGKELTYSPNAIVK